VSGPAADGVLLIHAFPMDARMWDRQVAGLAERWTVAAPSLPGFGGTPSAGPTMAMGAAADRCLQAADAAGIERPVVVGLSMGGYVAFELWRMARQRAAGFVLANTRSGADTPDAARARRALADRLETGGKVFWAGDPPPLLSDHAPDELWARVRETIADQPATSIAGASRGMAERTDSTPDLGTIDVPVLVITSSDDTLIPPEATTPMLDHLRDAELVTIPDAGHLSNLEGAAAFDGALNRFLGRFQHA
jgi:3-oxoadipate enol-lactonase